MMCRSWCAPALAACLVGVPAAVRSEPPKSLRVGLSGGLVQDTPEALVRAALPPMQVLLEKQTGFKGECAVVPGFEELLKQLAEGKVQVGIFPGHEFAWARAKDAQLRPLLIAVNGQRQLFVHVLVRADNPALALDDLKEGAVAVPRCSKSHCRLFVARLAFLDGRTTAPASGEDALDELVEGVVQAAVVDTATLECFQRRKPGRFARLKEVHKSCPFPAPVLAYRAGSLAEADLRRIVDGLARTHQTLAGKQVLTLWRLTAFEPVPDNHDQALAEIARLYPPPGGGR